MCIQAHPSSCENLKKGVFSSPSDGSWALQAKVHTGEYWKVQLVQVDQLQLTQTKTWPWLGCWATCSSPRETKVAWISMVVGGFGLYIWLRCLPLPCLVIQSALIPDQLAFKLPPMRSILINAIAWRMCKKFLIKAHSDSEVRLDVLAGQLTNGHHGRHNSVARSAKVRASMLSIENK